MNAPFHRGSGLRDPFQAFVADETTAELLRPIAEAWSSYAQAVVPRVASIVQRQESRRAFYAGAGALQQILEAITELTEED